MVLPKAPGLLKVSRNCLEDLGVASAGPEPGKIQNKQIMNDRGMPGIMQVECIPRLWPGPGLGLKLWSLGLGLWAGPGPWARAKALECTRLA